MTNLRRAAGLACAVLLAATAHPAAAKRMRKVPSNPMKAEFLDASRAGYKELPNTAGCRAGALSDAEKQGVVDTLNTIRALHGLDPVTYDDSHDDEVMQAALMMAANNSLNHTPPETWKCFSPAGALGAANSNLMGGAPSPYLRARSGVDDIIDWISDTRNMKTGVGHRIWLLNPLLKSISYGGFSADFDGVSNVHTAAIRIMDGTPLYDFSDPDSHPYETPRIIAYPFHDYPAMYYADGAQLSFAVVLDHNNAKNGGIDFSQAEIVVTPEGGAPGDARILGYDASFTGLPQTIEFDAGSLRTAIRYDIAIKNVMIAGEAREFDYWFRISPPAPVSDTIAAK